MAELGSFFLGNDGESAPEVRIDMLDFDYVDKCEDVRLMKAIVNKLLSGDEGHYPELNKRAEEKLMSLLPEKERSRIERLKKEVTAEEESEAKENMEQWLHSMGSGSKENAGAGVATTSSNKSKAPPRGSKATAGPSTPPLTAAQISEAEENMSGERQRWVIERERSKGNEFYKCGEFETAFDCYSKCLSLGSHDPRVYTNRAITGIKLNKFKLAEQDCTSALAELVEEDGGEAQIKAFSRRGLARFKMGKYGSAIEDFASAYARKQTPDTLKLLESAKQRFEDVEGHAYGAARIAPGTLVEVEVTMSTKAEVETKVGLLDARPLKVKIGICELSRRVGITMEDSESEADEDEDEAAAEPVTYRKVNIISEDSSDDEEENDDEENDDTTAQQAIELAVQKKEEGNKEMMAGNVQAAIALYGEGLAVLGADPVGSPDVSVALLNNRASAQITAATATAVDGAYIDADTVLSKFDGSNIKALYRRAQALQMKGERALATLDVHKILQLAPNNKQATQMLALLAVETPNTTPIKAVVPEVETIALSTGAIPVTDEDVEAFLCHAVSNLRVQNADALQSDATLLLERFGTKARSPIAADALYLRAMARKLAWTQLAPSLQASTTYVDATVQDFTKTLELNSSHPTAAKDLSAFQDLVKERKRMTHLMPAATATATTAAAAAAAAPAAPAALTPKPTAAVTKATGPKIVSPIKNSTIPTVPKNLYELERVTRGLKASPDAYATYLKSFKKKTFEKVFQDATFNSDLIGIMVSTIATQMCGVDRPFDSAGEDFPAALKLLEGISKLPKMDLTLSLLSKTEVAQLKSALSAIKAALPDKSVELFKGL
jgi:tetratricopeptide (TPR) repeat protein